MKLWLPVSEYILQHSAACRDEACLYYASVIFCLVFRPDPEPDDVAAARHEVEAELRARQVGPPQVLLRRLTVQGFGQLAVVVATAFAVLTLAL